MLKNLQMNAHILTKAKIVFLALKRQTADRKQRKGQKNCNHLVVSDIYICRRRDAESLCKLIFTF